MSGFDAGRVDRLREVVAGHVDGGAVAGVAWLAARDGHVEVGVAGTLAHGGPDPVRRDSLFRISSMTKPMVAVGALALLEEGRLRLDDPVDDLLPELADRRVLLDPRGPLDGEAVPAARPITVHDVLTFRLGLGMDVAAPWPQPLLEEMDRLGLGAGPPAPQVPPAPDEWLRRVGTLPLLHQPGERWLYDTGADVLGVLVARAAGQPLEAFLRERVLDPLGMVDTGFSVADPRRLGWCYATDPVTGEKVPYDEPDGQWASSPAFPSAAGGLVSTVDDVHAFGRALLAGGRTSQGRLLSRTAVDVMTTDHLGVDRGAAGPSFDGSLGWGLGVGVVVRRTGIGCSVGSYGWEGGLGSSWADDPAEGLVATILTTDAFAGPSPRPAVIRDFWTCLYAALAD